MKSQKSLGRMKKGPKIKGLKTKRAENLNGGKTQKSNVKTTDKSITIGNNDFRRRLKILSYRDPIP